jgi:hypothetical protein
MTRAKATRAVLTVGQGRALGRGFVVECEHHGHPMRIVITAAHCLPRFPTSPSGLDEWGWTYKALLGPLGKKPTVWAACSFVDIVGDIAVLCQPDNQELSEQADAYDALVDAMTPLPIADAPEDGPAWLLSLDGKWNRCRVRRPAVDHGCRCRHQGRNVRLADHHGGRRDWCCLDQRWGC